MRTSSVGVKQSCTSAMASSARGSSIARLLVGVLAGPDHLLEARVVVVGVDDAGGGPGHEAQPLHVQRRVGVAVGVLGPADDGRGRPVAHPAAVEHPELPGHARRGGDLLERDLLAELRPRVDGAVAMVLPGDAAHHRLELLGVDAVLVGVGGHEEGEGGRRAEAGVGAVTHQADAGEARVARVLELLAPRRPWPGRRRPRPPRSRRCGTPPSRWRRSSRHGSPACSRS